MMQGISAPEPLAFTILDHAVEQGINFIDTADIYQEGISETIIGRWMKQRHNRPSLVLATKVGGPMKGAEPDPGGLSRGHLLRACEASLRRLGADVIDLYQTHWPDTEADQQETLSALDELQRAGKIRFAGCSNYTAWYLARALGISASCGLLRFDCLQPQYSLGVRHVEREILPLCREEDIAVITWGPLASGLLSGKYRRRQALPAGHQRLSLWRRRWGEEGLERLWPMVDAVRAMAREHGCSPAAVALAWLRCRAGVSSIIIGVRTLEQLQQNLAAVELDLSTGELSSLDQVSALPPEYPTTMMNRLLDGGPFWD